MTTITHLLDEWERDPYRSPWGVDMGDKVVVRYSDSWPGTPAYSVSVDQVWVPGLYDTPETALRAATFTDHELGQIRRVWEHDGEDRPATMHDLDTITPDQEENPVSLIGSHVMCGHQMISGPGVPEQHGTVTGEDGDRVTVDVCDIHTATVNMTGGVMTIDRAAVRVASCPDGNHA